MSSNAVETLRNKIEMPDSGKSNVVATSGYLSIKYRNERNISMSPSNGFYAKGF